MAKKVVAVLRKGITKDWARVIRPVKNPKTGAYTFKEEMIPNDMVKDYFKS